MRRFRHHGTRFYIGYLLVAMATYPIPLPWWAALAYTGLNTLAIWVGLILMQLHRKGSLCEKCIAELPLNPQDRAASPYVRIPLRAGHILYGSGFMTTVTMVCVIATTGGALFTSGLLRIVLQESALVLLLLITLQDYHHSKYGPWCPWCDNGDGDDDRVQQPEPLAPRLV
ncbi:hypothetical protein ACFQ61_07145 [Streptomyces sp. NPDC056500]|uniref:hypothetical protein n=1 Tax=Streptomyces sp. NPDC056500 TaxID=3345840 RepID=UPI0036844616